MRLLAINSSLYQPPATRVRFERGFICELTMSDYAGGCAQKHYALTLDGNDMF